MTRCSARDREIYAPTEVDRPEAELPSQMVSTSGQDTYGQHESHTFDWVTTLASRSPGTVMRVDAHFDNSANNKFNPNPTKTVYYGTMTWEEMMNPFYSVVVPIGTDSRESGA